MTWRETRGSVAAWDGVAVPATLGMRGCVSPCHRPRWQEPVPRAAWQQGSQAGRDCPQESCCWSKGEACRGLPWWWSSYRGHLFIHFLFFFPPSCHSEGLFRKSPGSALQTAARELFRGYRVALTSLTAVIKGCCRLVSGSI